MISCAVSVAEKNWDIWLDSVGNMRIVRDIELPVALLLHCSEVLKAARQKGLNLHHAHNLLPSDVARYLSESPVRGRQDVLAYLKQTLAHCQMAGARYISIETGLDRIGEHTFESDLSERVRLLRALMPVAAEHRVILGLQVRYPRSFPGCREWENAANLVHEVMHPNCRLTVNVVPNDLADDFDVEHFVSSSYFHMAVLRFHYNPALGENLDGEQQEVWADALQKHAFKGTVVFCPQVSAIEGISSACEKIDSWAACYSCTK